MKNRKEQRENSKKEYASAKRKQDQIEKERSEYRASSMHLKRQQTQAIQQKNAIDFCKLLKDCGEYRKEEFDLLVKTTFDSIMKSQSDSNVNSTDVPAVGAIATGTVISTNGRGTLSNSDLSSAGNSQPSPSNCPPGQSGGLGLQDKDATGLTSRLNGDDCSGNSSSESTPRNTSRRVMNELSQPINTSMSPIILGDDSSDSGACGSDVDANTSSPNLQILTQARI